jgi:hypothetical protein
VLTPLCAAKRALSLSLSLSLSLTDCLSLMLLQIQCAFEALKTLFEEKRISSFASEGHKATNLAAHSALTPSWEFYQCAAEEGRHGIYVRSMSVHACSDLCIATDVPTYRVEPARSSKSECKAKGAALKCKKKDDEMPSYINKDELRVGILYKETGSYGLW